MIYHNRIDIPKVGMAKTKATINSRFLKSVRINGFMAVAVWD